MRKSLQRGAWALVVATAASGWATAEVFVTSPSTGRVLALDSTGAVIRTFGEAGGLVEPYGIVLDGARNLVVTDYAAGRIVRYAAATGNASIVASNIRKPDGLSIGDSGEFYLVSRDDAAPAVKLRSTSGGDATSQYLNHVWMIPAGGGIPVLVGRVEESSRLAQTALLTTGPWAGDLIVLSTRPGLIARYTRQPGGDFLRAADLVVGIPADPTAMAVTRAGEILIGTSDGRILKYSSAGMRLYPDFARGLATGAMRLSVTMDGVVHATRVGGTIVQRYDAHGLRLPDLGAALSPLAAALNSACVPTPVGMNVVVSPAAGINVIFDNVFQAGQTCLTTTTLGAGVRMSPAGNTIPSFALKLWEDPGFVVYDVDTTARFTDSIGFEFFSENPDARLMHAHGTGQTFADITTLLTPNDPRGRTGSLSEFVIYLDTRTVASVTQTKLTNLINFLNGSAPIISSPDLFDNLSGKVQDAAAAIGSGGSDSDKEQAIGILRDLKSLVRERSGQGLPNTPGEENPANNVSGNLLALADTLIFHLTL